MLLGSLAWRSSFRNNETNGNPAEEVMRKTILRWSLFSVFAVVVYSALVMFIIVPAVIGKRDQNTVQFIRRSWNNFVKDCVTEIRDGTIVFFDLAETLEVLAEALEVLGLNRVKNLTHNRY